MARKTNLLKNRTSKSDGKDVDALAIPKALIAVVEALEPSAPSSAEPPSRNPRDRAEVLARAAAMKAAVISGSLSLPPGPLGWVTAVPELLAIWKVQDQLVNDIAAAYGQRPPVQRDKMIFCLFKNMACQAAKDVAVRLGERALVRKASASLARRLFWRCGAPLLGAAGAAAYAWYDTIQVGRRASALFEAQPPHRASQRRKRGATQRARAASGSRPAAIGKKPSVDPALGLEGARKRKREREPAVSHPGKTRLS